MWYYVITAYNQTIRSVTGLTPFKVVFGRSKINSQFCVDFDQEYSQQLESIVKERGISANIQQTKSTKQKAQKDRAGETTFDLNDDDTIFTKSVYKLLSKDKPRYQKAKVKGKIIRNVVPVVTNARVRLYDIYRPTQVRLTTNPGSIDLGF